MWKKHTAKTTKLVIISLDCVLLFFFLIQSLVIGCLFFYGYIPISAKWVNQQLLERQFDGFYIQADSFRLKLWQEIELVGLEIYKSEIKSPIMMAVSAEVQYGLQADKAHRFSLEKLVLTNGTLMIPAIYAPDGKRASVLENVTLHLRPTREKIQINSFVAKHEDIYLRGSIDWPTSSQEKKEKASLKQFYQLVAAALKEKETVSPFIQPTLEFALSAGWDRSIDVSLLLSCEQLKHSMVIGNYFSLSTDFVLSGGSLATQSPLMLRARDITFADLDVFAEDITVHVKSDRWPEMFTGILPKFEISAHRLTAHEIELNAPRIMIEPSAFPILQFSGTTCGLQGNAEFSGAINSKDKSGKIKASGGIEISNLLPDSLLEKLPKLEFNSTPFYNLSVLFGEEFEVRNAHFYANFKNLTVNEIYFDNIITKGNYRESTLDFENIHIDRENQWVDAMVHLNTETQDFQITLLGSVLPKQYNSLLPKWWSNIFKDLSFEPKTPGFGDFVIYGNTKKNHKFSLFGYVQANNFNYKDAFFDSCELMVRGRQNYVEIDNIDARVGDGRATGKLGFTSARKPKKGLVSVRYSFNGSLPVEVASKSLGGEISGVLDTFKLTELPDVQVDGVVFNKKFENYAGKNFVSLQGKVDAPLKFRDVPLDYLNFKLIGQGNDIYLRDVQFGYADGTANAIIDILTTEDTEKQMCFKLGLSDANQAKAIRNLPSPKTDKQPVTPDNEESKDSAQIYGLVDLNLHAKGPLKDMYGFEGYGDIEVRNKELGAIQLLGPLSALLKNTLFNFTSFNLDKMEADFTVNKEQVVTRNLEINGPRTRISVDGTFQLPDQALDMDVKVSLFANVGRSDSAINAFGRAIASPLPNLLSFKLTGTVQDQKVRSKFDPRNLVF